MTPCSLSIHVADTMIQWLISIFSSESLEPEQGLLMPRTVRAPGLTLHFSMPENFSKDMPADDLIENVDFPSDRPQSEQVAIPLMKRWWDFYLGTNNKGKVIGTLMVSLDFIPRPEFLKGSLFEHQTMIDSVFEGLQIHFKEIKENQDILMPESSNELHEIEKDGANWVIAGVAYKEHIDNGVNVYSTPVNDDWYLRAWFLFSSGSSKYGGIFHRRAVTEQMRIFNSLKINFSSEVPHRPPVDVSSFTPMSEEEIAAFHERTAKFNLN